MPYKSRAQQGLLHARHPDIAARWDKHTSKKQFRKLPARVHKAAPMTDRRKKEIGAGVAATAVGATQLPTTAGQRAHVAGMYHAQHPGAKVAPGLNAGMRPPSPTAPIVRGGQQWAKTFQGKQAIRARDTKAQAFESGAKKPNQGQYLNARFGNKGANHLIAAARHAPHNAPQLYRGLSMDHAAAHALQPGSDLHLPMSSFTENEHIAHTFADRGVASAGSGVKHQANKLLGAQYGPKQASPHKVILRVNPGSAHVNLTHAGLPAQREWVGGGHYKVASVEHGFGHSIVNVEHIARLGAKVAKNDNPFGIGSHAAQLRHHQQQLERMHSFRPKGAKEHWTDKLIAHHQAKCAEHARHVGKRLPGETKAQTVTRHQRQIGGLLTAAAAIPAVAGLRSGRAASLATGEEKAAHAASQLRHASTAIGLGALGSATTAAPIPKRIFSTPTHKRNKHPKINYQRSTGKLPQLGYTNSTIGKGNDMLDGFGIARPDMDVAKTDYTAKERKQVGGGLATLGAGTAAGVTGMHLIDRGDEKVATHAQQGVRHASAAMKHQLNPVTANQWHAPGTPEHKAIGAHMDALKGVKTARAGIKAGRRLRGAGGAMAIGGFGSALVGGTVANHAESKRMQRHYSLASKAFTQPQKNTTKPSAGRVASGALLSPFHGLVAGKKGHKLQAGGSELLGGAAGSIAAGAATRGRASSLGGITGAGLGTLYAHHKGYLKPQNTTASKAYSPGSITYHHEQAGFHARKKSSAGRQAAGGLGAAGFGATAATAVHNAAPNIAAHFTPPPSEVGHLAHGLATARNINRIKSGAKLGGGAAVAGGLGVAGIGGARRAYHGLKQNKQTKLAQSARRQRNAGLSATSKAFTPPQQNTAKPSAGRVATGALVPGYHSLVAGKKGYKARAFGNEFGAGMAGGMAGSAIAGPRLGVPAGIAGAALGTMRAHKKGYLKPQNATASKALLPAERRARNAGLKGMGVGSAIGAGLGALATRKPAGAGFGAVVGAAPGDLAGVGVHALRGRMKKSLDWSVPQQRQLELPLDFGPFADFGGNRVGHRQENTNVSDESEPQLAGSARAEHKVTISKAIGMPSMAPPKPKTLRNTAIGGAGLLGGAALATKIPQAKINTGAAKLGSTAGKVVRAIPKIPRI
jgi:hypothetical protein